MRVEHISNIEDERLRDFSQLTDVALRRKLEPQGGLYLAESLKVIERALSVGHNPRAVLAKERWLIEIEPLLREYPDTPVFVAEDDVLENITGFHMHRGAIASMYRPAALDVAELLHTSQRIVVLEDLMDHTNVGAIFRSIAALGADAVLLTPACADPLYRRSVRVSMGAVLQVPWARLPHWREAGPMIRDAGFELLAFTLNEEAKNLSDYVSNPPEKVALMFGSEGKGLSKRAIASATQEVTIPMKNNIDSLNVSTAAAIALWALSATVTPSIPAPERNVSVSS